MTIADLLKDLIETSNERIKTPITGAYAFSFFIWNWRPIFLLLFENTSMTNKIIVINNEYCKTSAVLVPFLLGLLITLGVPYLMSLIDTLLSPAKKIRLNNLYKSKNEELKNQILLVDSELELQDKKNRNKEKEDFENQIKELEKRIDSTKESHKAIVDDYENKINELIKRLNKTSIKNENLDEKNNGFYYLNLLAESKLTTNDISKFHRLPNSTKETFDFIKIGYTVMNFLRDNNLIEERNDKNYYLTNFGLQFRDWIVNNNIKSVNDFK